MADAFHQTAIPGNHIGVMVNKIIPIFGRQMTFSHRHAHSVGNPLTKRAGCGFNPCSMAKFG